ncbi:hypothetical protein [Marinibactrum halimedae]|uniref:Uncharacterized protein n=1 Tax=Marinibactrum halimedae TaxID=1444977 RepID=A0AA37T2X6_9GAMM|nr:hypothetical protein [Marinibactrum halimedae]MCD9458611.1 hypothetical protein [Marinibactrum halimedae]GLS26024.1 hypothetical protein GCM10007877_17390 [Marinibactrum halimedae]
MDFSGNDQKAQLIALHYANQFNEVEVIEIIKNNRSVDSKKTAIKLAKFYWDMLDASIDDYEKKKEVLGEIGLQYWMERLLNIISGYLSNSGYEEEWEKVSDEA